MGMMKDLYIEIQELVWDAIEAGAKTDEDVYGYVLGFVKSEFISLETIKEMTKQYANEWM